MQSRHFKFITTVFFCALLFVARDAQADTYSTPLPLPAGSVTTSPYILPVGSIITYTFTMPADTHADMLIFQTNGGPAPGGFTGAVAQLYVGNQLLGTSTDSAWNISFTWAAPTSLLQYGPPGIANLAPLFQGTDAGLIVITPVNPVDASYGAAGIFGGFLETGLAIGPNSELPAATGDLTSLTIQTPNVAAVPEPSVFALLSVDLLLCVGFALKKAPLA